MTTRMTIDEYKKLNKKNNKYKNKPCEYNGYKFPSKLEKDFYVYLLNLQAKGDIQHFFRQVPLHLAPKSKLIVDFMVKYKHGFGYVFYDTKGVLTDVARTKINVAQHLYNIEIKLIKKGDF